MADVYPRIREELEKRRQEHSLRNLDSAYPRAGLRLETDGGSLVNFASNDYLDLAGDPRMARAASEAALRDGTGSAASRLITGNLAACRTLEEKLARLYGSDAALVFPTGYMANVGILSALADRNTVVLSDRLNHASILDGIRLSGAQLKRYPHNDAETLERFLVQYRGRNRIVITDTVFSMDGDRSNLPAITKAAGREGAFLILDEAHANGVLGEHGLGLAEACGLLERIDLVMGTFSKALGGLGGFVTGSREVIDYLVNRAGSLIYTTGLPPAVLASAESALEISQQEPERRRRLLSLSDRLRDGLRAAGWDTMKSSTQIIPVLTGENAAALALSDTLRREGFLIPAIRPPTVPRGTARLRISVSSGHTDEEINRLIDSMKRLRKEYPDAR